MLNQTKMKFNRYTLFGLTIFVLFFLSFTFNIFRISSSEYNRFDRGSEGYTLGRIIMTEVDGFMSHGGLPANYVYYRYLPDENGNAVTTELWEAAEGKQENLKNFPHSMVQAQMYDDYINNRKVVDGWQDIYMTQPNMMGNVYGLLHILLPIDNTYKLNLFRIVNLLLTALAFFLIVFWVCRNYGPKIGTGVCLLLLFSPWLMRFSHNLWWALWSFYIPFITMLFVLDKKKKYPDKVSDTKVYIYLIIAVFVKFLITGAEFITSTAVMAVCPIIYHAIEHKNDLKQGLSFFLKSSLAVILGFVFGFCFLFIQIKLYIGTWSAGLEHFVFSFTKRSVTGGSMEGNGVLDVLWIYLKEGSIFSWHFFPYITFGFGIFILITLGASFFLKKMSKTESVSVRRRNLALIVTTLISLLGPLSWYVMFVQHAYTHQLFDYIVWYMPFCIYAFIVLSTLFVGVLEKVKKQREKQIA